MRITFCFLNTVLYEIEQDRFIYVVKDKEKKDLIIPGKWLIRTI
jgi:hypothetical protein